jgi:hypothetical protein
MSFKKLYEKMRRTPKNKRFLIEGGYEYEGARCIIGTMVPLATITKLVCQDEDEKSEIVLENVGTPSTWKILGPYIRKFGLTRREATYLQEINDAYISIDFTGSARWRRVFQYVKERALKEVRKA